MAQSGPFDEHDTLFELNQHRLRARRHAASQINEPDFDREFIERLKGVSFREQDWEYTLSPQHIALQDRNDQTRKLEIWTLSTGRDFAARPEMTHELVAAANIYKDMIEEKQIDQIDFEIESSSDQDCRAFLRELQQSGLDVSLIKVAHINGNALMGDELEQWKADTLGVSSRMRPNS